MDTLSRIAAREFATFLSMHLPARGPRWWTTHVEERLTDPQQQRVRERNLKRLDQLDFAALLRIVDQNWFELSEAAQLPREGRDWVRELKTVRNKWAHASAEQDASEDIFRDADTLGRCLRMLGAGPESLAAVETVKSTALRKMAAESGVRTTPPKPTPAPTKRNAEHTARRYPARSEATVEVQDHALWTKHIQGDDTLKATLNGLRGRSQIELEVDGFRGTWQKMDDGKDGRPTTGIKPVGPAQAHWHTLLRDRPGSAVAIAVSSKAHNDTRGRDEQSFEAVWAQIRQTIGPGDTIRNWSRHSGYRGSDFTIHAVTDRFVEIDSPGATHTQHITAQHFARVHEHWIAYNTCLFARSGFTAISRFSTYVISILHHVLDRDRG